MTTAAIRPSTTSRARPWLRKSPFFTILGVIMLVLALGGFWPQYFTAVTGGTPAPTTRFWLVHVHAGLFVAWMVMYLFQAALIMAGSARTHLRLGPWLAAYGFLIGAIGIYTAGVLAHRLGVRENSVDAAASFIFFPLIDMMYFIGFLVLAVIWRKRPALHKRAMFVATYSIAVVGIGRLVFRTGWENPLLWQPTVLAPLVVAVAYDLYACRKIYPILVLGLAVHLFRLNADPFTNSDAWLPIGRMLVAPFG